MCVIAHTMRIAILGTGPIGSTFALHLARAGHDVTAIARGKRLEQLRADQGIVTVDGERAAVKVSPELDPAVPFDLVLVTVLATGVGAVLPRSRRASPWCGGSATPSRRRRWACSPARRRRW
jgi:2-dehydropantoate 2-reductase